MKKVTKRAFADPELREMVKLMELEEQRDEMRKLENERIAYARKQRDIGAMSQRPVDVTARGWTDKTH